MTGLLWGALWRMKMGKSNTSTKGGTKTKELLMHRGAEIIHRKGFNHTGLNEILEAAGVPKGSFYFYFKSKLKNNQSKGD